MVFGSTLASFMKIILLLNDDCLAVPRGIHCLIISGCNVTKFVPHAATRIPKLLSKHELEDWASMLYFRSQTGRLMSSDEQWYSR